MSTKSAMSSPSDLLPNQFGGLKLKREMPAWMISVLMHAAVLVVLALITHATGLNEQINILTVVEDLEEPEFIANTSVLDQIGTDGNSLQITEAQQSATEMGQEQHEQAEQELEDELLAADIPVTNMIVEPNEADLQEEVDTTGTTENVGGVEGAIDRLTLEIAASLREGKTLVCWVFDVSPSLSKRREVIADRFENVYKQLGLLEVQADKSLKTAVAAFGAQTTFVTPDPVDDVKDVVSAIRKISPDTSGDENVFSAVSAVAKKWSNYRTKQNRKMMIIVVTDEAGSDQGAMEEAINYTKRYGIRCYVVGNAAPFGRRVVRTEWELDNGDIVMAEMDQGPESIFPERLQLPFWASNGSDLEKMSSAFGPYALTRLCAETNGLYFVSADTPGPRFDHEVMRGYQPDYLPVKTFDQRVRKDPTKSALLNASLLTWSDDVPNPQLGFEAPNDTELRQQITNAQMPIARLEARLMELSNVLEMGEKTRPQVRESRWRAGYDLAMGRVLAMKVRAAGYNAMLAEMKSTPKSFENPDSNFWQLNPSQEITSGMSVGKLAKRATAYLTRVIDEHPGTPWARLAELELSQPLGWEWEERKVMTAAEREEERKNNPRFEEEERERMERARKLAKPPIKI
ncbi:MAG: VWA domain-containing protein [Planctomycetota bacterium]|nr:VWA domain-containing protein [Planctomycetota bacterium]MDA1212995.1 VWA domain-containing protein [Planctomycetota bacterium]